MDLLLLLLAVFPGLLICFFIYQMDKYEKEGLRELYICFALGMLATVPVMELEVYAHKIGLGNTEVWWKAAISSFVVVALSEELVKYLLLLLYPFPRRFFNEPMDGIIYAVVIAMGFATLENILYAYQFGVETIILRAFTAVPAHAAFSVIMGFFVGKAKFKAGRRRKWLLTGLAFPVAIHGTYDFFILQEAYDWLILFAIPILALSLHFAYQLIRIHQEDSPFKPRE